MKWLLSILLLTLPAEAVTVVYVSNYPGPYMGSDSNTGTSPTTAFLTLAHLSSLSLPAGSIIYLICGSNFHEVFPTVLGNGTSSSPITVQGYGGCSVQNPAIVNGADLLSTWTPEVVGSYTAYYASEAFTPPQVLQNNHQLISSASKAALVPGSFWYDATNQRVYVITSENANPAGVDTIEASVRTPFTITNTSYVNVNNVEFDKSIGNGIYVTGTSSNINLLYTTTNWNYNDGIFLYSPTGQPQNNITVRGAEADYNRGIGILKVNSGDSVLIDNSSASYNAWDQSQMYTAGIRIVSDGTTDANRPTNSGISNSFASYNGINPDTGVAQPTSNYAGYGIWCDTCGSGSFLTNNVADHNVGPGINVEWSGTTGPQTVTGNVASNNGIGIYIYRRSRNVTIKGNTADGNLVNCEVSGEYGGVDTTVGMQNIVFEDNICTNRVMAGSNNGVFEAVFGAENSGGINVNNVYQYNSLGVAGTSLAGSYFVQWGFGTYLTTYAQFDTDYGSSTNSIETDPLLTAPLSGDYRLQAGSPAIGAGVARVDVGALRYGLRHYISSSGSDSNSGLTTSAPWLTIGKVNAYLATGAEQGGDRFWFNGGNRFSDAVLTCANAVTATSATTLTTNPPNCSGVRGNPIVFESYGTGKAIFDGADPLSLTWTEVGSTTTYSAPLTTVPDKLYVDCPTIECWQMIPAPNGVGAYSAGTTYHFLDLTTNGGISYIQGGLTSILGVTPVALSANWLGITNTSAGNTTRVWPSGNTYLQNLAATPNSWYANGTNIYVHLTNGDSPSSHTFEGSNRVQNVLLNGVNYVTVNNITMEHPQKTCLLSQAYTNAGMGGNYWTSEYNTISNTNCWNAADLVEDSTPTQTSNHPNALTGGIIVKNDGYNATHEIRGNLITNNYVGTLDAYFGLHQLQSWMGGIVLAYQAGRSLGYTNGIPNNFEEITNNTVRTYVAPCIVSGIPEVTAFTGYQADSFGGSMSYNNCDKNIGNLFWVDVIGGRVHHNVASNGYGEGIQVGNSSTSSPSVPQSIDHDLIFNLTKSQSAAEYNGVDCNSPATAYGGTLDHIFETNMTIFNVWGGDFTIEGNCTNSQVHNGIYSQFSNQFPAFTLPNSYFLMYAVNASHTAGVGYSNNFWQIGTPNGGNWYNINGGTSYTSYASFFSAWPDVNSVGGDPGFSYPLVNRFSLSPTSAAIAAGTVNVPYATIDAGAIPYTQGTTWYVRPDGGTRYSTNITTGTCDGKGDSAPSGSTPNQHCAFNDVRMLYQDGSYTYGTTFPSWGWVIAGGDTVIIRGSIGTGVSYRIGWNSQATYCDSTGCWGITGDQGASGMPPPPSGTPMQHTRIYGENYASCHSATAKTQLHGGWATGTVMALDGASFVDVACLDLTDFSACGRQGQAVGCDSTQDFTENGMSFYSTTHDITLTDINAHGLADSGFAGPTGGNVTMDYIGLEGNASAGWNSDPGDGTTGFGTLSVSDFNIVFNGCAEQYPIVAALPYSDCRDDTYAGYGDGFGTTTVQSPYPGWQITWNKGTVAYNTQDGLDALHVNGYNSSMTVMNTLAYGNEGQQIKAGPTPKLINNNIVGNCRALNQAILGTPSGFNASNMLGDLCRAGNTAVLIYANPTTPGIYAMNSLISNGAIGLEIEYQVPDEGALNVTSYVDNMFFGGLNTDSGQNTNVIYSTSDLHMLSNPGASFTHNSSYGYSSSWTCPNTSSGETNGLCSDPGLVDETFHAYGYGNIQPASSSSSIYHAGTPVTNIPTDFLGVNRNATTPTEGAYEQPSGASPTLISITVTPNTSTIIVTGTVALAAACLYSDGSTTPCSVTWSDTGGHASVNSGGLVTGVSVGADTISATIGSIAGSATVTVIAPTAGTLQINHVVINGAIIQ
jgi:parallel beta-helix repeat protein